jgi:NADPH-dependent 2,4-dienoyl-CoA reductase/sulfur reductase-like enzyme
MSAQSFLSLHSDLDQATSTMMSHTMPSGGTARRSTNKKADRVAIVGAGVAGCAMAAALRDQRIDFVVYDKNSKAGGLWADNYPGAKGMKQSAADG